MRVVFHSAWRGALATSKNSATHLWANADVRHQGRGNGSMQDRRERSER
jgi:hypothetical protein